MADSTISALAALAQASVAATTDAVPIVNGGATKKITPEALALAALAQTANNVGVGGTGASRKIDIKKDGAPGLRLTNTTGGAGQGIELLTAASKLSWLLGAQYNVSDAFEITSSTTLGGTTFSTPTCVFIPSAVYPGTDNAVSSGLSSNRWSVVYAGTGTINTSDANLKTDVADLDEAERATARAIKGLIKKFRFKDAAAKKGDGARIHVGAIAQEVAQAFRDNGLDPERYALFCSDTWREYQGRYVPVNENNEYVEQYFVLEGRRLEKSEDPPEDAELVTETHPTVEVTQLGLRYEELLAFVIAAL